VGSWSTFLLYPGLGPAGDVFVPQGELKKKAILGVYDILLSYEYNRELYKKCPCFSKLHNGSEWLYVFKNQSASIHDKSASPSLGVNKGLLK